ncbi:hypothetical protein [Escherichia coli]|uniref:hypothetical protein n=1 Tax=Escherichia coli TaxID=562 RepID=UPI0021C20554|nr:hypothetical protein [Escherichia coli]
MSNQQLSANQIAYLNRAMSDGNGLIEIGELARGLGKRPDNVKRKLERIFPEDHLLNLRKRYKASIGKGASREIETYMLDYKTAGAAYFHERRSLNNFHRDRVITFEQIAE